MKNKTVRICCLILSVVLTLSAASCKKKDTKAAVTEAQTDENMNYVFDQETGEKLPIRKLKISNSKAVQENFLGFNAISQGFMYIPDAYGRDYSDKQRTYELERIKNTGIKMIRSYYDQGYASVLNNDGSVKKNSDGSVYWDFDNDIMQGLYKWLEAMKDLNITVILNLGWSAHVLGETTVFGQKNPFEGMTVDEVTNAYADWVCRSVDEIIVKRGYMNVKYGVVFTEPQVRTNIRGVKIKDLTEEGAKLEGGTLRQTDWYVQMMPVVDAKLKAAGLRDKIKLIGPNATMADDITDHPEAKTITIRERVQWYVDNLNDYIDVWAFHWYAPRYPGVGSTTLDMYVDSSNMQSYYLSEFTSVLNQTGKEFWFDELNYSYVVSGDATHNVINHKWGGTQLAELLISNLNAGLQNSLLWSLNDIQWPLRNNTGSEFKKGVHMTGTYPSLNTASTPYLQYYAYSMLCKYLGGGEGTEIFEGNSKKGVYSTMVQQSNGDVTVMVVNTNISKQAFCVGFDKSLTENGVQMYRHIYDPETVTPDSNATIIGTDKIFTCVSERLQDTLPPGGVAVYTTIKD